MCLIDWRVYILCGQLVSVLCAPYLAPPSELEPTNTTVIEHDTSMDFDEEIIDPDMFELLLSQQLQTSPKCANGLSVCEDIQYYPHSRVKNILEGTKAHFKFAIVDDDPSPNRMGEENLCGSIETVIFPKAGLTKRKTWKYIINQDNFFAQGIRVEKCIKANAPCSKLVTAKLGYVTICTQKYIPRILLSLGQSGEAEPDSFMVPSACSCSVKRDAHFISSFRPKNTPAFIPGK